MVQEFRSSHQSMTVRVSMYIKSILVLGVLNDIQILYITTVIIFSKKKDLSIYGEHIRYLDISHLNKYNSLILHSYMLALS